MVADCGLPNGRVVAVPRGRRHEWSDCIHHCELAGTLWAGRGLAAVTSSLLASTCRSSLVIDYFLTQPMHVPVKFERLVAPSGPVDRPDDVSDIGKLIGDAL
jgi:hypothetical protein